MSLVARRDTRNHVRVRNNVHHVQISVEGAALRCIRHAVVVLENLRQAFEEISAYKFVQLFEAVKEKWVLVLAGRRRGTQIAADIVISDASKQHNRLYEKKKRIGVLRRVSDKNIRSS